MAVVTRGRVLVVSTLVLTGCTALLGVNDIFLDDGSLSGADGGEGGKTDGPSTGDGGDATTCNADLTGDALNCGRCGHSCLGGLCTNSACGVVTVMNAVSGPWDLALDDAYVYVANNGEGTVKRAPKDLDGGVVTIVPSWDSPHGIAVADGKLFWMAYDSAGDGGVPDGGDGNDAFGGVWSCTLPACNDKRLIQKVDYGYQLAAKNGYVYSASDDGLGRVKTDGTGGQILVNGQRVFGIAPDDTHAYFITAYNTRRVLLDGGGLEDIGPIGDFAGLVGIDDARVFWTYNAADENGAGGTVFSTSKAKPGDRVSYGTTNIRSYGVVSDGTNVYWANQGNYDGPGSPKGDGQVLACPVTGCGGAPIVLADKLLSPTNLALDGDALYFLEYGSAGSASGRLLKVAKP